MNHIRFNRLMAVSIVPILSGLVLFASPQLLSQEHPEHPKKTGKGTEKTGSTLTPEALAVEVMQYVEEESKLKGGPFLVYDAKSKKPLVLTLDKVHKDKLSKVAEGTYFACSDFKSEDGKTYDLDFFMKESDSGLQVTEITVHKENGKARYVWAEEKGIWKRQEK